MAKQVKQGKETKTDNSLVINELMTLPSIILALIGASRNQRISKKLLEERLVRFSIRDVDEAITFLQYKGLIMTDDFKPNGDYTVYPTF